MIWPRNGYTHEALCPKAYCAYSQHEHSLVMSVLKFIDYYSLGVLKLRVNFKQ